MKYCNPKKRLHVAKGSESPSEDSLCIPTLNTGQLNPLLHTFAEYRLIVNRVVAWQSTDWFVANAQFSPNDITTILGIL